MDYRSIKDDSYAKQDLAFFSSGHYKYFAMIPSSKKAEVKGAFKNIKQSCIDSVKSEDSPYFGISISIDPDSYKKEKNNLTLIISFNNKEILDKFIKKLVEPVIKGNFKKNEANFEIKEL